VTDGDEERWNSDTDWDGIINALDSDSDGDGLKDGEEVNTYGTSMILVDTDSDTLSDYDEIKQYQTDAISDDTDEDGLKDNQEAYDGWWYQAEEHLAPGASDPGYTGPGGLREAWPSDTGAIALATVSIKPGTYKVMANAKVINQPGSVVTHDPLLTIDLSGVVNQQDQIPMITMVDEFNNPLNVPRWFSTLPFEITNSGELTVEIGMTNAGASQWIGLDSFAIIPFEQFNRSFTNPLFNDTDIDGLYDGRESAEWSYWFEAEDFAVHEEYITYMFSASKGRVVQTGVAIPDPTTSLVHINTNGNVSEGLYALFIKGYSRLWSFVNVSITYLYGDGEVTVHGTYEVDGQYQRGLWKAIYFNDELDNFKFYIPNPSNVQIELSVTSEERLVEDDLFIDKILLTQMNYSKPEGMFTQMQGLVPRQLIDPLDADTDGDQYRTGIGADAGECLACHLTPNVTGYLIDSRELDNGMNPMSLDTDSDGLTDDIDPNPISDDSDDDGLPDFIEDSYPEGMPDGVYNPNYENTDWCNPDTDHDRVLDGTEDWNFDDTLDPDETDPNDPDTDGDGLLDGGCMDSTLHLNGSGHDYTVAITSEQFTYLSSRLRPINVSGVFYNPWFDNGDGTVTFVGEWDVGSTYCNVEWKYQTNKRPSPQNRDSDGDRIRDGVEVFVYGTNPTDADTDGDGYSDYNEIYVMGTNPLVVDRPDLVIVNVSINPEEPEVDALHTNVNGIITVDIKNTGTVTASGRILVTATSNSRTVRDGITDLGANQTKQVTFYYKCTDDQHYTDYRQNYPLTLVYKAGIYSIDIKIDTQNPSSSYDKIAEKSYANNENTQSFRVKGSSPTAYIYTNYYLPLLSEGDWLLLHYGGRDADGEIVSYEVDYEGDGIWDYTTNSSGTLNHTYATTSYNGTTGGSFWALVRVTDNDGKQTIDQSEEITVMPSLDTDTDGDGLTNQQEIDYGTNLYDADFDQDTLTDYEEVIVYHTLHNKADSDSDGLRDDRENIVAEFFGMNATGDADNDGIANNRDADSDNDGIKDGREYRFCHPDKANATLLDWKDSSYWRGTSPYCYDSDLDGIWDIEEEKDFLRGIQGRLHFNLNSMNGDTDGDGLPDYEELYLYDTASDDADTDNDGLPDNLDNQPLTGVESLGYNMMPHDADTFNGIGWTEQYATHMIRYDMVFALCGTNGSSYNNWLDVSLDKEGILDSDISEDAVLALGLGDGDIQAHWIAPISGQERSSIFVVEYTDGLGQYSLTYRRDGINYRVWLWNIWPDPDPSGLWYTAWKIGLDKDHDNSLELQFQITPGSDSYYVDSDGNYDIPAFFYKLYKHGNDGLSLSRDRYYDETVTTLINHEDCVFGGIAQATPIPDSNHFYQAEIKLPADEITNDEMFLVLQPAWLRPGPSDDSHDISALDPHDLHFASMSKLVYYRDENETLRFGVRNFEDLADPVYKPNTWQGEVYYNFTKIEKIGPDEYKTIDVSKVKKTYLVDPFGPFDGAYATLDKLLSASTVETTEANLVGEITTAKFVPIKQTLTNAERGAILTFDETQAIVEFPESSVGEEAIAFGLTTTIGILCDCGPWAPLLGPVSTVCFGAADIAVNLHLYYTTDNPIIKQQALEGIQAARINTGLNLIPFYFVFEIAWKGLIYELDLLIDIPPELDINTLADPGALLAFVDAYFEPFTIPSQIAKNAFKEAEQRIIDHAEDINLNYRAPGEWYYLYIPPYSH